MPLLERAAQAFDAAAERADGHAELAGLRDVLEHARRHLDEPLRVAIVGHIKAGKSTMLNALVGADIAPTGKEELTFNVNWLRYAPRPSLIVHFKNGRAPEEHDVDELHRLTARSEDAGELLRSIKYIELRTPCALLKTFDLVDTPGLKSFYEEDSMNTLRSLGLSESHIDTATREESALADAILCLFSRSLAAAEQSLISDFQGPLLGAATPINAIGVLTKVDAYWDASEPERDPLEEGRRVASIIQREPDADKVFFTVLPVCGLLGFGAQTVTDAELERLAELARLDPALVAKRLRYAERFATREYDDVAVGPADRAALLSRLGQYGIWGGVTAIRDGVTGHDAIRERLLDLSGVGTLRELIVSHFGHRALLIKSQNGVRKGRAEAQRARAEFAGGPEQAAFEAAAALEELECGEPAFEEFGLLRMYYRDAEALGLRDGEHEHLLEVTGEHGTTLGPRLGLPATAAPDAMVKAAERRLAHWRARGDELGADPRTVATARVMTSAYRRLLYHASEVRRHLELED